MSKKLPTQNLINELHGASAFFQQPVKPMQVTTDENKPTTPEMTSKVTRARDKSRRNPRENRMNLPNRDEVQEFSFRLRDEFKVKVQAEVPYQWQEELEERNRSAIEG